MKKILFTFILLKSLSITAQVTFSSQNIIKSSETAQATDVFSADIDGDGDMDILSASALDDKIAWYENTDGNGSFGPQQIITTSAINARSVFAVDIDGDGDIDVLSAGDDKIAWYENTEGNGSFGSQQIITTSADGAESVFAIDIDGDGDMDVLSASRNDDKIAWYENTDGNGSFGSQQIITTSANGATSVFAIDIDGDGDMDMFSASHYDDKIAWYENTDGHGSFGPQQIITTSADDATSVFAIDIDGDGDMDVLSASAGDDKIAWYENLGNSATVVNEKAMLDFSVYPVPTKNILNVKSKTEILKIEFYNKLGQLIRNTTKNQIDISNLIQGLYFIKVEDVNGTFGVKKIIKK